MNRREALLTLGSVLGGTIFGAQQLLAGAVNAATAGRTLSAAQLTLLNELAETIIPATPNSPGAKAANLAGFMQEIVRDYYSDAEFATFAKAIDGVTQAAQQRFGGRDFLALNPTERFELLMAFEKTKPAPDWYRMVKQLTVWGYFSSEIGSTQALAHVAVPGRFEGVVTVGPEARAWAQ